MGDVQNGGDIVQGTVLLGRSFARHDECALSNRKQVMRVVLHAVLFDVDIRGHIETHRIVLKL